PRTAWLSPVRQAQPIPNGAVMVGSWHQPHDVVQMFAPGGGGRVSRGGRGDDGLCSGLGCGVIWADGESQPLARTSATRTRVRDDGALTAFREGFAPPLLEPRVERVAQAVAEEIEPEHGHEDRDAGEERDPGV